MFGGSFIPTLFEFEPKILWSGPGTGYKMHSGLKEDSGIYIWSMWKHLGSAEVESTWPTAQRFVHGIRMSPLHEIIVEYRRFTRQWIWSQATEISSFKEISKQRVVWYIIPQVSHCKTIHLQHLSPFHISKLVPYVVKQIYKWRRAQQLPCIKLICCTCLERRIYKGWVGFYVV